MSLLLFIINFIQRVIRNNRNAFHYLFILAFLACCYFLSPVLNPFLYCMLSKRFRRGFHDLKQKISQKIWSSQSSSSQECMRANYVSRPFISLPNQPSPRFNHTRERNTLLHHTEEPRRSFFNNFAGIRRYSLRCLDVEMIDDAVALNDELESNQVEMNPPLVPNLGEMNGSEKYRFNDAATDSSFNRDKNKNQSTKCKSKFLIKSFSFNADYMNISNNIINQGNSNASTNGLTCFINLRTIKRTKSLSIF